MNEILSIFHRISKVHIDKTESPKVLALKEVLNEFNLKHEFIPGLGIVVNKQDKPRIVVVSHFDLIKRFQKGFSEEKPYELEIINEDKKVFIKGALDNTITNSVSILVLKELIEEGIEDIELVLTEEEETTMNGIRNYLKTFSEKRLHSFFINLDVTNEGWKSFGSIEYDRPSAFMLKQIQSILDKKVFFTNDRVCDDTDIINELNAAGLSFCLPTKGNIHSYNNFTSEKSLVNYKEQLILLLKNLKISQLMHEKEYKFEFSSIMKAASYEEYMSNKVKSKIREMEEPSFKYVKSNPVSISQQEIIEYIQGMVEFDLGPNAKNKDIVEFMKVLEKLIVTDPNWHLFEELQYLFRNIKNEKELMQSLKAWESVGALEMKKNFKEIRFYGLNEIDF